jgi:hypothetical protein
MTAEQAQADPANHFVTTDSDGTFEVTAAIPAAADTVAFGAFLAGPGQIELRDPHLTGMN